MPLRPHECNWPNCLCDGVPTKCYYDTYEKDMGMQTYKIIRFYQHHDSEIVAEGQTLEQAQAHCTNPETSWKTATGEHAKERTKTKGPWFDGYQREGD